MFQASENSNRPSVCEEPTTSSLKDEILSLTHRLNSLQHQFSSKVTNVLTQMDRQECLSLMERKVNTSHLKKVIKASMVEQKRKEEELVREIQDQHAQSIKALMKKLGQTNFKKQFEKKFELPKSKVIIKPQELYLQSNETMFGMIIEQLEKLKGTNTSIEKTIQNKHKNTINLNNEVCRKIDLLERQIEGLSRDMEARFTKSSAKLNNNWSVSDIHNIKKSAHIDSIHTHPENNFESIKLENMSKTLESIQKEMINKVNLKDVLPILKKNLQPTQEQLIAMKSYIEESLQSMRKILLHQSEINEELCGALRVGWWQSCAMEYSGQQQVAWEKELINMYPEGFISKKSNGYVTIANHGTYLFQIFCNGVYSQPDQEENVWLIIDQEKYPYYGPKVMRVDKNSKIAVISSAPENYLCIQKL